MKPYGPVQRADGKWLAYRDGLPLMRRDFANRVFSTREAAEDALRGYHEQQEISRRAVGGTDPD